MMGDIARLETKMCFEALESRAQVLARENAELKSAMADLDSTGERAKQIEDSMAEIDHDWIMRRKMVNESKTVSTVKYLARHQCTQIYMCRELAAGRLPELARPGGEAEGHPAEAHANGEHSTHFEGKTEDHVPLLAGDLIYLRKQGAWGSLSFPKSNSATRRPVPCLRWFNSGVYFFFLINRMHPHSPLSSFIYWRSIAWGFFFVLVLSLTH